MVSLHCLHFIILSWHLSNYVHGFHLSSPLWSLRSVLVSAYHGHLRTGLPTVLAARRLSLCQNNSGFHLVPLFSFHDGHKSCRCSSGKFKVFYQLLNVLITIEIASNFTLFL